MIQFSELQQQVAKCLAQQKYSEAVALCERSIEADPTVMSNYWHLGLAWLLQGEESEAQATWLSAMAQGSPEQIEVWTAELVGVLAAAAQRSEADSDLKYAWVIRQYIREFDPANLPNLLSLIWLSPDGELLNEAKILLRQATQLLLSEEIQEISPELLVKVVDRVLDISPFQDFIEIALQREELLSDERKAGEIKNKLALAYNSFGKVLYQQGSFAQAASYFQKALNTGHDLPKHDLAGICCKVGIALANQGEWERAVNFFQEALEIEPGFTEAQDKLNWARYEVQNRVKGYQFTQDWFSWNIPILQVYLGRFAHRPDLQFLEIGSWEGRSTCWLLENILTHESGKITCIDTFEGSVEHKHFEAGYLNSIEERFDFNIAIAGAREKVTKIVGMSQEVMRALPLNCYDTIYIDGSHLPSDVLADAVLSWGLLKVGGLMIFDDYDFEFINSPDLNTKIGIDAFLTAFKRKIKILHVGGQVILEKTSC
ncbi:MAG: class I SAM-dependent methyltransferase [Oscillatoria princeps RMCB-10]|jgi:tetratricopeptide (TPR) repeat protein|nr:class I SAM-dependent methyltransferase [Oscillatoria princeps RMCB-10]